MAVAEFMARTELPVFVKQRNAVLLDDFEDYAEDLRQRIQQLGGMM